MLWGEKQIGRNRGLRRMEKVGNSCCEEMGVRTNQEIQSSPTEDGYRDFRGASISQIVSLPLSAQQYGLKKVSS